jgi:membrane-associated protein
MDLQLLLHPDLVRIITAVGYLGVFAIVFAESGLFFGFFLPGDSLLFTAGLLASRNLVHPEAAPIFDLRVLAAGCFLAAVLGDQVGYTFGRRVGRPLFNREDSLFFHKKHLERAEAFYARHGGKAIVLARFMPVVRTFAPIVAGVGQMHYPRFLAYNVLGGALWGGGLTTAGYYLGSLIPPQDVDKYLLPIVALIIVASVMPPVLHVLRDPAQRANVLQALRRQPGAPAERPGPRPGQPASVVAPVVAGGEEHGSPPLAGPDSPLAGRPRDQR